MVVKYDEMKLQLSQMGPPSPDSLYELNKRVREAEAKRKDALNQVELANKAAEEKMAQLEKDHKESIKFLEKENLDLLLELRKLGKATQ